MDVDTSATIPSLRTGRFSRVAKILLLAGIAGAHDVRADDQMLPDLTVVAPAPPSKKELAGDSVFAFVKHHGSTHYSDSVGNVDGGLTRWLGNRPETICPETIGLQPSQNEFVSAHLRATATLVGAPVRSAPGCKPNVTVLFTPNPEDIMKAVIDNVARHGGGAFPHRKAEELKVGSDKAVQAWYFTASRVALNGDPWTAGGVALEGLWPRVVQKSVTPNVKSILSVVIVINTNKVVGARLRPIADYIAMITLTVVQTPDFCDLLPSILDLFSSACGQRQTDELTAGDVAFLKALYYKDDGVAKSPSRDDMVANMVRQWGNPRK